MTLLSYVKDAGFLKLIVPASGHLPKHNLLGNPLSWIPSGGVSAMDPLKIDRLVQEFKRKLKVTLKKKKKVLRSRLERREPRRNCKKKRKPYRQGREL